MVSRRRRLCPKVPVRSCLTAAALLGTGLTACSGDVSGFEEFPFGIIRAFVQSDGRGGHVTRPEAEFVLTASPALPSSRVTIDSCLIQAYSPSSGGVPAPNIDAGDSIGLTLGGGEYSLLPRTDDQRTRYELPGVAVPVQSDQVITVTIPGALDGFPMLTIASPVGPMIESVSPIPAEPGTDDDVAVTWSPPGDDSSKVELSLRYASDGSAGELDTQVLCDWPDVGTNRVPGAVLTAWRTAPLREIRFTRYRTTEARSGDAFVFLMTAVDSLMTPVF